MKVLSLKNVEDMKHDPIPFEGEWYQAFGRPERSGSWIIYGKSGQGKTHFALLMAREFDRMGFRTMFIPLEMGYCERLSGRNPGRPNTKRYQQNYI